MPALPAITAFTDAAVTEGNFKTALADLRAYLAGLFGEDGKAATALSALAALFGPGVVTKTGAYTVQTADKGKLVDCSGTFALTLPAAATAGAGFALAVRNSGAGVITIDPSGAELINRAATVGVAAGSSAIVVCTGAAWLTVGQSTPIAYPISVENGGTGATNAAAALANLGALSKDMGYNAIGSYCLARNMSSTTISAGGTISGSSLRASDCHTEYTSGSSTHNDVYLTGTWRCVGKSAAKYSPVDTNDTYYYASLFQRIA